MKTMRTLTQACLIAVLLMVQAATTAEQPKVLKQIAEIEQTLERRGLALPETAVRIRDRILQLNAVSGREHGKIGDAIRFEKVMTDFTFEVIYQQWLDGAWVNDTRTIMTWDDQMEIIGFLEQDWQGGAWVNSARLVSVMDGVGNITELRFDEWVDNAWVTDLRITYQYDARGNETQSIMQMITDEGGALENALKTESVYDGSNRLTEETTYYWEEGAWQLIEEVRRMDLAGMMLMDLSKTLYTYTASGLLQTETRQTSDNMGGWDNESRVSYEYNAAGEPTVVTFQTWDGSQWVNGFRYSQTYGRPGGAISEELSQVWEEAWVNQERTQYSYDGAGNNTVTVNQLWEGGQWVNDWRSNDSYNNQGIITESVEQTWQDNAWVNEDRYLYNYSVTSVEKDDSRLLPGSFSIGNYPNPFNPQTTIRFQLPAEDRLSLQITDLRGRVVRTLVSDQPFDAGTHRIIWNGRNEAGLDAPSGVYFYRVIGAQYKAAGRCVLMK